MSRVVNGRGYEQMTTEDREVRLGVLRAKAKKEGLSLRESGEWDYLTAPTKREQ